MIQHIVWLTAMTAVAAHSQSIRPSDRQTITQAIEQRAPQAAVIAKKIWEYAEVGFQETRSSGELQNQLRSEGFTLRAGIAGMPTAFVAAFKNGEARAPTIALLAEFDALPGQSQAVEARRAATAQTAGHACGHNLLGEGAVLAAIAVKEWLVAAKMAGEIRVYGTPAEEGGSGKVFMAREGLFDDVDVVLHWHPNDTNTATQQRSLANMSGKFRFYGRAAHAARAPEQGRSALDGVEAMNYMVNALREHVPQDARIHYVITRGGESPNVVPDFAEVYYYVRHVDPDVVRQTMQRVMQAAAGAAQGTETRYEFEMTGAVYPLLPNDALGRVVDAQLRAFAERESADDDFALRLAATLGDASHKQVIDNSRNVARYVDDELWFASTDVGDVSWVVPTAGVRTATWALGTPAHSWQATAASGSDVGLRGMHVASLTLATTAAQLWRDPKLIASARAELQARRGAKFKYQSLLGDQPPALNYRRQP